MGFGYDAAIQVAAANAQWKEVIRQGTRAPGARATTAHVHSKCPGCGSWDYSATENGTVCSYCQMPAVFASRDYGKQTVR